VVGSIGLGRVCKANRAAGAKLSMFLPYSPELNPIEQAFATVKHRLRQAAERASGAEAED